MTTARYSLKKRLLGWICLSVLMVSALIFIMAYFFSRHEIGEVYDAQLVHSARTLLQLSEREGADPGNVLIDSPQKLEHKYENKTAFRVWRGETLVRQSRSAEHFSIDAPPGFSDQKIDGHLWRFFVFIDSADNLRIETAEQYSIRYESIGQLMISLAIPMGVLIPSLLLIVWITVQKSLKPIVRASAEVDARRVDDLSPIADEYIPAEIRPLIHALNRLFVRIHDSFRREREFTDHAAHELRTPLAALKTQTQVLMKKTAGVESCRDGFNNLALTIDRAAHLVDQLLLLARIQNEPAPAAGTVDLSACAEDALSEVRPLAAAKNVILHADIHPDVTVRGCEDALFILVRNVLDNAVKYTPDGGSVTVVLTEDRVLSVSDTGPGIPDADKGRVFERFARIDRTGQAGSGLGLSIVKWIAQTHGVNLTLSDNAPSGLVVTVRF